MRKLIFFIFFCTNTLLAQVYNTPAADCNIAERLCDANVSYSYQLLNDGVVDDAYPTLGVPNLFRSQPTKWEARSCFLKFTAKYSGTFGFTICPEVVEPLSYLFLSEPNCDNLESGAYSLAYNDDSTVYEPVYGCRGMGVDPLGNGSSQTNSYPFTLQNIQSGSTYMIFVRIRWYTQPGSHRFTISFQGSAVTSHPDLFEHPECLLATTSDKVVNNFVSVYPNPFSELINVVSNVTINKTEIYNLVGERVYSQQFSDQIYTAFLSSGVYFVKLYGADNAVFVRKIVKK